MSHHERKAAKHEEKHLFGRRHSTDKHAATAVPVTTGTGLGTTTATAEAMALEGAPVVHTSAVPVVVPAVPVVPVVPVMPMQGLSLADRVVHEPEQVIRHAPLVEKEIINERPVELRREHHIQPVVHETEHRVQPIIKTEATTEQPVIVQDRNVMLAPVVERAALPAGLEAVERVAPEGIIHAPKVETVVVDERPVEVRREHHVQPIIHEREHRIQPIIRTEATTERPIIEQDRNVMHAPIVERAAMPAGLEAVERVAPEGVIHAPRVARDVVVEHPVEVRHERHIQPIIHEREHHIQPIVKTEVTAQQTHLKTDRSVMLEPVVERAALPLGLEPVERAGPEGVLHRAKLEREVVVEHPVEVRHEHHIQPVIHERVHHIQPVIKTEVTSEQRVINQEHTVMLPPIIEPTTVMARAAAAAPVVPLATAAAPVVATTTLPHTAGVLNQSKPLPQIPVVSRAHQPVGLPTTVTPGLLPAEQGLVGGQTGVARDVPLAAREGALGTTAATMAPHKPTMGQRLKGAVKQLQGTITGNELKKEEGKLIAEGVDPATARAATTSTTAPVL